MKRLFLSCLLLSALSMTVAIRSANAASFDCAKATWPQKRLICTTPTLSKLDEQLDLIYKHLLSTLDNDPQNYMRSRQQDWVQYRELACRTGTKSELDVKNPVECLGKLYQDRIKLLSEALFTSGPYRFLTVETIAAWVDIDKGTGKKYVLSAIVSMPRLLSPPEHMAAWFNKELERRGKEHRELSNGNSSARITVQYASDTLISLLLTGSTYPQGALQPTHDASCINWLLRECRALEANDLFNPKSNWQEPLAILAYEEMKELPVGAADPLVKGPMDLREIIDNPNMWLIGPETFVIKVSPSTTVEIPWVSLKPYLVSNPFTINMGLAPSPVTDSTSAPTPVQVASPTPIKSSLKVKGLYIGMPSADMHTFIRKNFGDIGLEEQAGEIFSNDAYGYIIQAKCDAEGKIGVIRISSRAVDKLFDAGTMQPSEFAEIFRESYGIPKFEVSDDGLIWFYKSPEGWMVAISSENKELLIGKIAPASTVRKKFD